MPLIVMSHRGPAPLLQGQPGLGAIQSLDLAFLVGAEDQGFIPTSSSWLNLIERWFRDLTTRRLRRGVFHHVRDLITAIEQYIAHHNTRPRVFTWMAKVDEILVKIGRAERPYIRRHLYDTLHSYSSNNRS